MFLFSNLSHYWLPFSFGVLGCVCYCDVFVCFVFLCTEVLFFQKHHHTVLRFMLSSVLKVKSYFMRSMVPTMIFGNLENFLPNINTYERI